MQLLFALNIDPSVMRKEEGIKIAKVADEFGIDIISMQDHPYNSSFFDTWTYLAYLAAITEKVKLMTNVANIPLRFPVMLAKSAATLDVLTRGRVELGIGAGAYWEGIEAMGLEKRNNKEAFEAFREALIIMRLFFNIEKEGEVVSFEGKYYKLRNAELGPKPFHRISIWIGGYRERMLKLTGELADGWTISLPYLPPQELPLKRKIIDEYAKKKGRDPKRIRTNYNFGGIIVKDQNEKTKILRTNVLIGTIEEWIKILKEFYNLGVDTFTFWAAGPNKVEQAILFAKEVVPRFKEAIGYR